MAKRQYVVAKFRLSDSRTFTYHNDETPVKKGDEVKLPNPRAAEGEWIRGYVTHIHHTVPSFLTKEILGLAPPKEEEQFEAPANETPTLALGDDAED